MQNRKHTAASGPPARNLFRIADTSPHRFALPGDVHIATMSGTCKPQYKTGLLF